MTCNIVIFKTALSFCLPYRPFCPAIKHVSEDQQLAKFWIRLKKWMNNINITRAASSPRRCSQPTHPHPSDCPFSDSRAMSYTILKCACALTAVFTVLKCACAHTELCKCSVNKTERYRAPEWDHFGRSWDQNI